MRLFSLHNPTKKSLERFRGDGRPRVNVLFLILVFDRIKRLVPSDKEKESSSCNVGLRAANVSNQLKDRHVQAPTGKIEFQIWCFLVISALSAQEFIILFIFYGFSSAVDPSHSLKSTCQSSHDSWTRHCQSVWIINKKYTSALQFPSQGSIQFISSLPPQRTAPSSLMAGHCRVTGKFARLSGRCGLTPDPWPLTSALFVSWKETFWAAEDRKNKINFTFRD